MGMRGITIISWIHKKVLSCVYIHYSPVDLCVRCSGGFGDGPAGHGLAPRIPLGHHPQHNGANMSNYDDDPVPAHRMRQAAGLVRRTHSPHPPNACPPTPQSSLRQCQPIIMRAIAYGASSCRAMTAETRTLSPTTSGAHSAVSSVVLIHMSHSFVAQ